MFLIGKLGVGLLEILPLHNNSGNLELLYNKLRVKKRPVSGLVRTSKERASCDTQSATHMGRPCCAGEESRVCAFTWEGLDGGLSAFAEWSFKPLRSFLMLGPRRTAIPEGFRLFRHCLLALGISDSKGLGPPQL